MFRDKLDIESAITLEDSGNIMIIDVGGDSLQPISQYGDKGNLWKENFITLQKKSRHISPDKILDFYNAKYFIELSEQSDDLNGKFAWRYLYAVPCSNILDRTKDNVEYVYILVNDGYPNLVKIGMTVRDIPTRVAGMNSSAVVDEWYAKFGVPVEKGSAYRIEQQLHKHFSSVRVTSDKGNQREFFEVDCLTACDKMREVAAAFMVGNCIVF